MFLSVFLLSNDVAVRRFELLGEKRKTSVHTSFPAFDFKRYARIVRLDYEINFIISFSPIEYI